MMIAFLTIALLHLLAVISPGPDFALILKNTLCYAKHTAVYSAAGLAASVLLHCSYCILGLALIIANSIVAFNIIKFIGAGYLIFIGGKSLLAKKAVPLQDVHISTGKLSNVAAFRQGLLCNLLNPKATLFFLGIFTLVVKPDTSIFIQTLYSLEMCLMTFVWFSVVAFVVGHAKVKQELVHVQHTITKVLGACLIAFGCKLAFLTR